MKVITGQLKERNIPSVGNGMSKEWHAEEVGCLGGSRYGWSVSALGGGCLRQNGSSWWQQPEKPQEVWLHSMSFILSVENS